MYEGYLRKIYEYLERKKIANDNSVISAYDLANRANQFMGSLFSIKKERRAILDIMRNNVGLDNTSVKNILNGTYPYADMYNIISNYRITSDLVSKTSIMSLAIEKMIGGNVISVSKDFGSNELKITCKDSQAYLVRLNEKIIREMLDIVEYYSLVLNQNQDVGGYTSDINYYKYSDDFLEVDFFLDAKPSIFIRRDIDLKDIQFKRYPEGKSSLCDVMKQNEVDLLQRIPIILQDISSDKQSIIDAILSPEENDIQRLRIHRNDEQWTYCSNRVVSEQKARAVYENLIDLTNDEDIIGPLLWLRQREVVHYNRFKELFEYYEKKGY